MISSIGETVFARPLFWATLQIAVYLVEDGAGADPTSPTSDHHALIQLRAGELHAGP
jgi:hypothetical protein